MNFLQFMMTNRQQVLDLTFEHITLAGVATLLAALVGIPLGILITRIPQLSKPVLGSANIIQTIPSLALFGFLLPAPWIGERAGRLAILVLALYALLPLIRNTYTGIQGVDPTVVEAGRAMGMTNWQLLFQVELPLASGGHRGWIANRDRTIDRRSQQLPLQLARRIGRVYFFAGWPW